MLVLHVYSSTVGTLTSAILSKVASRISTRDFEGWKQFALDHLKPNSTDSGDGARPKWNNTAHVDNCFKVLKLWRDLNGTSATVKHLQSLLRNACKARVLKYEATQVLLTGIGIVNSSLQTGPIILAKNDVMTY